MAVTVNTKSHGGSRPGAGRKHNSGKFKEQTHSVRIPISVLDLVTDWLEQLKQKNKVTSTDTFSSINNMNEMSIIPMTLIPSKISMPFYDCSVSAGFPSPADDSFDLTMDLNKHLVKNAPATFFVRTSGDSMINAGIHHGDLLVVDRSLNAKHNDIVIAAVNGDLTVKRLIVMQGKIILKAENSEFSNIEINEDTALSLWGVVTNVIHSLRI